MSSLLILRPAAVAAISSSRGSNVGRLLGGDPREVWRDNAVGTTTTLSLDLGTVQPVDTLFLGYTNAGDGAILSVLSGVDAPDETGWSGGVMPAPYTIPEDPRHGFVWRSRLVDHPQAGRIRVPDPIQARYITARVRQPVGNDPLYAGALAVGAAFQPVFGREYGGGRTPVETGSRERLASGSFGVSPGNVKGSWDWTMGDLTADEVDALWRMAKRLGETRSVLVVEDPDVTPGLAERLHWGMFDKLQPYSRLDPALTRWSFRIEDWA
jgi:hypothetical protein